MCLIYDKELTDKYKKRIKPFIAYKLVETEGEKMTSPYRHTEIVFGINKSDRESIKLLNREKGYGVNAGCHLYLTIIAANEDLKDCEKDRPNEIKMKILKVEVKPKDIVAAGTFEYYSNIEFKKMELPSIVCMKYKVKKENNKQD